MSNSQPTEWPEPVMDRLKVLWAEGPSTAKIGEILAHEFRDVRYTKNAVVGKAHRLNLPPRPSPVKAKGSGAHPKPRAVRRLPKSQSTLPSLVRFEGPSPGPQPGPTAAKSMLLDPKPVAARGVLIRPAAFRDRRTCCYPISEQTDPHHRYIFCEDFAVGKGPYCEVHMKTCYQGRRAGDGLKIAL